MPEAAMEIIRGQKLGPGASLVKLANDLQRPTAKDCTCFLLAASNGRKFLRTTFG